MAFQFKIQLKNISAPTVWRRLVVPEKFSFYRFHRVIQEAFGWDDYHLFSFSPGGYNSTPEIGIPDPEWDMEETLDCKKTKLNEIFMTEKQKYTYIYDFGDDWTHTVVLEKITADKPLRADCLGGKGACPPEDCGGPWGYGNMKEILNDPKNPEHEEMKEWLGLDEDENWDAGYFDLEGVREAVRRV